MEDDRFFRRQNHKEDSYSGSSSFGLSNLTQLSPETQTHLQNVYRNLTITTGLAALAIYLSSNGYIMGPGIIATLMLFGCLFAAVFLPGTPDNQRIRHAALYGAGFAHGWMAEPMVSLAIMINPNILLMTVAGAAAIFGSFTMSAYYSPRRQYLYLGGLLGTAVIIVSLIGLSNMFIGSSMLNNLELYLGLFVFSMYVLYDTQVIVERSEAGSRDAVTHSMTLFTDLAAIFVRLLMIMMRNNENRRGDRRKRN